MFVGLFRFLSVRILVALVLNCLVSVDYCFSDVCVFGFGVGRILASLGFVDFVCLCGIFGLWFCNLLAC